MNVKKTHLDNFIGLKFYWVSLENHQIEMIDTQETFDLRLLDENNITKEEFENILSEDKTARLYEEEAIWIIKRKSEDNWSEAIARKDAKAELNKVLNQLPESHETIG